ncbi:antibiotic biosynthesis monooxygenase family protein [Micromonospora radicis]|uniref:Antibiotic biosynthesis monooxygenase n=1 Tax=Micromonospora radicis TaxID=1894971 RepID=A0A418MQN0_9ACTN|nr:antibiotic biosynthesis monooxygenase [Micromonospora radicis]RIV35666.1 antibiotic biosynthesis monooxygenase [Micromonospora radicis]
MLVTNRFVVDDDEASDFTARAHAALAALAARPGYLRGQLVRALDDPRHWCLVTEWESVGTYRRALGGFDVKVTAVPLLAQSIDEPSAYETLANAAPGGDVVPVASDRAAGPYR